MRTAECVTAALLMGLSVWFMFHATVLPIGWVEGSGPGGGAFPFWLAAIMFVCAAAILVRELKAWRLARKIEPFIERHARGRLAVVVVSLAVTVALIHIVGTYVAIPAFLFFYLRFLGRHGWLTTGIITVATPVALFFFFEVALKILLPKGITEPWFFPLYAMFF